MPPWEHCTKSSAARHRPHGRPSPSWEARAAVPQSSVRAVPILGVPMLGIGLEDGRLPVAVGSLSAAEQERRSRLERPGQRHICGLRSTWRGGWQRDLPKPSAIAAPRSARLRLPPSASSRTARRPLLGRTGTAASRFNPFPFVCSRSVSAGPSRAAAPGRTGCCLLVAG